jgi:hypothetical protein
MVIRKEKDVEKLLKAVDKIWQLNLNEDELLETVFNLILAGKTKETADVLNFYTSEEWENLLLKIPKEEVKSFSRFWLKMIDEDDIEDDLTLKDFRDEDIKREYNSRGLGKKEEYDIVTQSQLDELVSNFISADFNTRKFILSCSENSDINTKLANFAEKYLK